MIKYITLMILGYVMYGASMTFLGIAMFTNPIPRIYVLVGMLLGLCAIFLTTLKIDLLGDIFRWAREEEKRQRENN